MSVQATYSEIINAPHSTVWDVLADIGSVSNYSPGVLKSHLITEQKIGLGAVRHCDLPDGVQVEETITEWQDQQYYRLSVTKFAGMPIMQSLDVDFRVDAMGDQTRVTETMTATFKLGLIGVFIGKMMKSQLEKALQDNVSGLKSYIEQGQLEKSA